MSKVLIIGNGFDLDLGLKTSYKDFVKSEFFEAIADKGFPAHIKKQLEINNWIDLEMEIRRAISDPNTNISTIIYGYNKIAKALHKYLESLDISKIDEKSVAAHILNTVTDNDSFKIFTYNYTNLNKITDNLEINRLTYQHVHGSLNSNSLILGVDDDVELANDQYAMMIKSHNPHFRSLNIRNELKEADEVIFFGHSLGVTDYHYFSDFFLDQSGNNGAPEKRKTIRIFTYDENSRQDILMQLRNMNNKKTNQLFDLNDFRIYKTCNTEDHREILNYSENLNKEKEMETLIKNMGKLNPSHR